MYRCIQVLLLALVAGLSVLIPYRAGARQLRSRAWGAAVLNLLILCFVGLYIWEKPPLPKAHGKIAAISGLHRALSEQDRAKIDAWEACVRETVYCIILARARIPAAVGCSCTAILPGVSLLAAPMGSDGVFACMWLLLAACSLALACIVLQTGAPIFDTEGPANRLSDAIVRGLRDRVAEGHTLDQVFEDGYVDLVRYAASCAGVWLTTEQVRELAASHARVWASLR